ncbi:esterase B1-like [Belonocnema kinseyi]|uniref:esterase B1-like n=1 Tax=Belonocnema kinseyi TaxID=2817044 RepID=UPI00143D9F5F|nr:esterase B1-like [Belonocnema kinseyi]XP_033223530.1 esterase B1-like [Belonocnema kinseyi]
MILSGHILVLFFGLVKCQSTDIVQTTNGPVQGEILKTVVQSVEYSSFKGIPYGEAPTGYNRFKPPVKKKAWTEVLVATQEGSVCVQMDFVYGNFTGAEDCLYLNVYSPHTKLSDKVLDLKPVIVWIYGGSFKSGYSNSSLYGPDFIIEEGVVLVTFNYRLGPFGFLCLNHPNATGNAGLKDQNMVLRWVKQNIDKFGGDPNSVTIMGQSAGGVAVDFHSLSRMSRGLFHRSIAMSAAVFCPWAFHTPVDAVKRAFQLGNLLGQNTTNVDSLLETLYEASAKDIVENTEKVSTIDPPFKPTLEDAKIAPDEEKFMTECYLRKYKMGNFYQVPHLMGFTSFETIAFGMGADRIHHLLSYVFKSLSAVAKNLPIFLPFYQMTTDKIAHLPTAALYTLINETTDLMFVAGIDYKQQFFVKKKEHPVYYYRLIFDTDESLHRVLYDIKLNGTAHGDDLAYLFYISLANPTLNPTNRVSIARQRIVRMWTNFAKYGNPTPAGKEDKLLNISWPDSGISGEHLEIGDELTVKSRPVTTNAKLYQLGLIFLAGIQSGCTCIHCKDL